MAQAQDSRGLHLTPTEAEELSELLPPGLFGLSYGLSVNVWRGTYLIVREQGGSIEALEVN